MSKDCRNHGNRRRKLYRRLFAAFLSFIFLILLIIFIIWLVLRPTKPRFSLQDASINQFNVTAPSLLTTSLQISINSRNPNDRIGIYYDKLDVYASYRNQQITVATVLPPTYQGHNDIIIWSPFLNGVNVPVSPYLTVALNEDQNLGSFLIKVKIDGRLRWKVGSWTSGRYHINVNCPAYIRLNTRNGNGLRLEFPTGCATDV
ncbi:NDR1/HIN1-like protein 1 [Tasmannia lanceolata]|uniref:NDR1/HIN1-like protein 1 n=1 Tax=Tasmannia lanceolata TaxID=3420 RepID=UPI004063F185